MAQPNELEQLMTQGYVPSSVERKKAVLMYAFFGIVISLVKKEVSVYEKFHLKQAMGRRLLFMITLVASIILVFIKYLNLLPILFFIPLIGILAFFVRQARTGFYTLDNNKIFLPVIWALGGRILDIFEIEVTQPSSPTPTP